MASAQVLPNSAASSRKQELLDAGKRRLEEFRMQKAQVLAKKAAKPSSDSFANEKQLSNGQTHVPHSEAAGTSARIGDPIGQSNVVASNDAESLHSKTTYADPTVPKSHISFSSDDSDLPQARPNHEEHHRANDQHKYDKTGHDVSTEGRSRDMASFHQYSDYGHRRVKDALSDISDGFKETPRAPTSYGYGVDIVSSERSVSTLPLSNPDSTQPIVSSLPYASDSGQVVRENSYFNKHLVSEWTERKPVYNNLPSLQSVGGVAIEESQTSLNGFNFVDRDSKRQVSSQSSTYEAYPRRSRPSFLDSLNIPRGSSASGISSHPQLVPDDVAASASHDPFSENRNMESHSDDARVHGNNDPNSFPDQNLYMNHVESNLDLPRNKNGAFDALEQHIEDLTQEKFSLQRGLEASKSLAESLAAENSSLTESYNQQGSIVAQLKSEMESLQAEIKILLAEHESIRIQYANAQLECNAADERAQLLASEVIGLEEKALRLRSTELKLEKELEKSSAEVASCRKKMMSLEKERQDLQMTIDAMQEENKLLQVKLRKAASERSFDDNERKSKKNVSTSTDDLEVLHDGNEHLSPTSFPGEQHASASSLPEADNLQLLLQNGGFGFDGSAMIIPSDQVQMIQNINALLSELMEEKVELSQALIAEVSTSLKLKDLNKELSQRLEAQTQRLELLTSQSMAKGNVLPRQPTDSQIVQENVAYSDEGDEVVERVMGWIMKLFPGGGQSRRRTL